MTRHVDDQTECEAIASATSPEDRWQPLRNDVARALGLDPESLHPDAGRRAEASR